MAPQLANPSHREHAEWVGLLAVALSHPRAGAAARMETLLDAALEGWRDRRTWRRDQVAKGRTGALDLPGTTWRDRPAIDRGDGVYLAGDSVAAPGLLGEVAVTSAVRDAELATGRGTARARAGSVMDLA